MSKSDPVVFESDSLFAADAAAALLDTAAIPYSRSVFSGGIEQAMPLSPTQSFGQIWLIRVPRDRARAATVVLDEQFRPTVASVPSRHSASDRSLPWHMWVGIIVGLVLFGGLRLCG